jgi:hypothetical protein
MGYTHYFTQHQDFSTTQWAQILEAVEKITALTQVPLDKTIAPEAVDINGCGPNAHENLYLTKNKRGRFAYEDEDTYTRGAFGCCKTAHKPYDAVITAVLAAIELIAPEAFSVDSDGLELDWLRGLQLASKALGCQVPLPKALRPTVVRMQANDAVMTEVTNLATGETVVYALPPEQAVLHAYMQHTRGNWNWWEYPAMNFVWGKHSVAVGDWCALIRAEGDHHAANQEKPGAKVL